MSIPTPFTGGFPFNQNPFRSRVESQINASKNYYAVAFKAGYPLQASELNEIQEIFYVQNTLNSGLQSQGWTAGTIPWNGCTPYTSSLIFSSGSSSITATASVGWYLVKHSNTNAGFGVWVYNDTARTVITGFTGATGTTGDYGIVIKPVTISCTTNDTAGTTQDRTLQDSHNMNFVNGPCGADRLKLQISGFGSTAGTGEYVVPIFTAVRTGTTGYIGFRNGLTIRSII